VRLTKKPPARSAQKRRYVGISVQGQDANSAWKTTYNILKAIKVPVEVALVWQDNPETVAGRTTGN
jgi:hypothetical protein